MTGLRSHSSLSVTPNLGKTTDFHSSPCVCVSGGCGLRCISTPSQLRRSGALCRTTRQFSTEQIVRDRKSGTGTKKLYIALSKDIKKMLPQKHLIASSGIPGLTSAHIFLPLFGNSWLINFGSTAAVSMQHLEPFNCATVTKSCGLAHAISQWINSVLGVTAAD